MVAVVADPETAFVRSQVAIVVARTSDAEGFAEAAGAAGQLAEVLRTVKRNAAGASHFFDSRERFERTKEDASGFALGFAGNVQAVVVSVDEVDVGVARRPEEDGVAKSASGGGVGSGVCFAEVSFEFNDAGSEGLTRVAD